MNIDSLKEFMNDIASPKVKREQKTEPQVEFKIEEIEEEEDSKFEDTIPIPDPPPKGKLVPP